MIHGEGFAIHGKGFATHGSGVIFQGKGCATHGSRTTDYTSVSYKGSKCVVSKLPITGGFWCNRCNDWCFI
jgi:hypothetical protein